MGFCKPMSEEVPLINTKTISKEELDAQRENAAKVQAVLQSRYTDKPLACVITYGCQQNVADSEHIKGMLADMGYAFTDDRHKAQFILFNTCAVREHAEDRVFGNVGALKSYKAEHPDTVIALCGCMMQQQHIAERIKQSFPFVDLVFGTHVVHRLPELLLRTLTRKKRVFELPDMDGVIAEGVPVVRDDQRRAWLPIMYGCNNFCTYCIVPYVRGREISRKPSDVIDEDAGANSARLFRQASLPALAGRLGYAIFLLRHGDGAGLTDEVVRRGAGGVIKERLCRRGERLALAGHQNEGTLHGVGAVQNGLLGAVNAVHLQRLDAVLSFDRGERGIADGVGVRRHSGDHSTGGGQLLREDARIARAGDGLKAVARAAAGLTADAGDCKVFAAELVPVLDLALEDGGDLFNGQIVHGAVLVDDDRDAVERDDRAGETGLARLERAGGKADIAAAGAGGLNARAGAGGVIGNADAGVVVHELLGEDVDDLLHRGGAVRGNAAGKSGGRFGSGSLGRRSVRSGGSGGIGSRGSSAAAREQRERQYGGHSQRENFLCFHNRFSFFQIINPSVRRKHTAAR